MTDEKYDMTIEEILWFIDATFDNLHCDSTNNLRNISTEKDTSDGQYFLSLSEFQIMSNMRVMRKLKELRDKIIG